jgi:hypothetical protein
MATDQSFKHRDSGLIGRLLLEHPRSLGMSWASHGAGAFKIGAELMGASLAAFVHAAVPGWFTETAGRTVTRIYDHIQSRKASAANPEAWPDYEI